MLTAAALAFTLRNLRRNVEDALPRSVGDIVGQAEMAALARVINALTRDTTSPEQRPGRLGGMEIRTCAYL